MSIRVLQVNWNQYYKYSRCKLFNLLIRNNFKLITSLISTYENTERYTFVSDMEVEIETINKLKEEWAIIFYNMIEEYTKQYLERFKTDSPPYRESKETYIDEAKRMIEY